MRKLTVLVATTALLFAACGEDDGADTTASGSGSGSGSEAVADAPVELEGAVNNHGTERVTDRLSLELDDFYFGPTFIQAEPGSTITIELENGGDENHTFTSAALDVDEQVAPGESTTVEVTLPDEGATAFFCSIHKSQGMQGAIFSEEGDEVSGVGASTSDGDGY